MRVRLNPIEVMMALTNVIPGARNSQVFDGNLAELRVCSQIALCFCLFSGHARTHHLRAPARLQGGHIARATPATQSTWGPDPISFLVGFLAQTFVHIRAVALEEFLEWPAEIAVEFRVD